jgi:hypothetical protein
MLEESMWELPRERPYLTDENIDGNSKLIGKKLRLISIEYPHPDYFIGMEVLCLALGTNRLMEVEYEGNTLYVLSDQHWEVVC